MSNKLDKARQIINEVDAQMERTFMIFTGHKLL